MGGENEYSSLEARINSSSIEENAEYESEAGVHRAESFAVCAANAITHYCPDEAKAGYSGECTASISIEMTREFCS